jgi:hypothetical protein
MTKEHLDLITNYSKGTLSKQVVSESKGEFYCDLLDSYLNDLNSSRLRQDITCNVLGLATNDKKLGYDSEGSNDEVKPKNVSATSVKKTRLDCGGNYSDLTHKRHNKYIQDNAIIHSAGFVDGQLMYIIKVPYVDLAGHFQTILNDKLPDGDLPNRYVRSASFNFKQVKACPNIEIEFVREDIENYSSFINKELYTYLKGE